MCPEIVDILEISTNLHANITKGLHGGFQPLNGECKGGRHSDHSRRDLPCRALSAHAKWNFFTPTSTLRELDQTAWDPTLPTLLPRRWTMAAAISKLDKSQHKPIDGRASSGLILAAKGPPACVSQPTPWWGSSDQNPTIRQRNDGVLARTSANHSECR